MESNGIGIGIGTSNSYLQIRGDIHIIFFLFLLENICCGYSLEAARRAASNEYHNICFHEEIRKISAFFG